MMQLLFGIASSIARWLRDVCLQLSEAFHALALRIDLYARLKRGKR